MGVIGGFLDKAGEDMGGVYVEGFGNGRSTPLCWLKPRPANEMDSGKALHLMDNELFLGQLHHFDANFVAIWHHAPKAKLFNRKEVNNPVAVPIYALSDLLGLNNQWLQTGVVGNIGKMGINGRCLRLNMNPFLNPD